MPSEKIDILQIAARKGLVLEAHAREVLAGHAPTTRRLIELGLLRERDVVELLEEYEREISRVLGANPGAAAPCPKCGGEIRASQGYATCSGCSKRVRLTTAPAEEARRLPPEAEAAAADPANLYGRFIRVAKLGEGGFGAVWRAWDPQLGRAVALKIVKSVEARDLARFHREARMAASLDHTHIVPVYDVGESRGEHYIAMKYVQGVPAHEAGLTMAEVLVLGQQVAEALAYAHERGIVHRDIKPGNILVTRESNRLRAHVTDFGLAKPIEGASLVSFSGEIVGTIPYVSPEQAEGRPDRIGPHTDQWALGVTLYTLLSGRLPFRADSVPAMLQRITHDPPEPLEDSGKLIPKALDHAIRRCLRKDPEERWPGLSALAKELQSCAAEWSEMANLDTMKIAQGFTAAPPARRRAPWAVIGAASAVVVLVFAWFLFRGHDWMDRLTDAKGSLDGLSGFLSDLRASRPDLSGRADLIDAVDAALDEAFRGLGPGDFTASRFFREAHLWEEMYGRGSHPWEEMQGLAEMADGERQDWAGTLGRMERIGQCLQSGEGVVLEAATWVGLQVARASIAGRFASLADLTSLDPSMRTKIADAVAALAGRTREPELDSVRDDLAVAAEASGIALEHLIAGVTAENWSMVLVVIEQADAISQRHTGSASAVLRDAATAARERVNGVVRPIVDRALSKAQEAASEAERRIALVATGVVGAEDVRAALLRAQRMVEDEAVRLDARVATLDQRNRASALWDRIAQAIADLPPTPDDHPEGRENAPVLALPASVEGTLGDPVDDDWFAFEAEAGKRYRITVGLGTSTDTILELYDSTGVQRAVSDDAGGELGRGSEVEGWSPAEGGVFTVRVRPYSERTLGSYTLTIEEMRPRWVVLTSTAGVLEASDERRSRPNHDACAGEFEDVIEIAAETGDRCRVAVASDAFDPYLWITLPDGSVVTDDDSAGDGDALIEATIRGAGTVRIGVTSYGEGETGAYELTISRWGLAAGNLAPLPGPDDHGGSVAEATPVVPGMRAAGAISYGGDDDWFAFPARAGVTYVVRTELETLSDSVLTVAGPDGVTVVGENDDDPKEPGALHSRVTWECAATGTYYARVRAYDGQATGSYGLRVEAEGAQDQQPDVVERGVQVEAGSTVGGAIERAGERDRYWFAAEAGRRYVIRTQIDSLRDTYLTLYGPDGATRLAENDDAGLVLAPESEIEWTCPESGAYVIEVRAARDDLRGRYRVSVETAR